MRRVGKNLIYNTYSPCKIKTVGNVAPDTILHSSGLKFSVGVNNGLLSGEACETIVGAVAVLFWLQVRSDSSVSPP
jgi:hypothetical protein